MKRVIALLLLLFPLMTFSQITFQPGYFIERGTKTECLIKNLAWKNNPVSIEYKLNESDDVKIKSINEISEFNVNNAYKFRRFTLNIDRSPIELDRLSSSKEPEWKKETVFLKVLVEGKISLYQFEDSNFIKYFYSTGDHSVAEQLIYKEYLKQGRVAENGMFRQQLYNSMKDGGMPMNKFERLKYKKDDLVKLFTTYNGAEGETVVNLAAKQNQGSLNLKITPGASFSKLSAEYGDPYTITSFAFNRKPSFRIGVELEYIMPFNNNKWSLFLDPNYQTYKSEAQEAGKYDTAVDYTYIELPIGFRHYMYLNEKSRFFVDAAYILAFSLNDSYVRYNGAVPSIVKTSGFAVGGGFSYSGYSIEARYNMNHGLFQNEPAWGTQYNSISIILGYKLL